jgi:hypothetical protein
MVEVERSMVEAARPVADTYRPADPVQVVPGGNPDRALQLMVKLARELKCDQSVAARLRRMIEARTRVQPDVSCRFIWKWTTGLQC